MGNKRKAALMSPLVLALLASPATGTGKIILTGESNPSIDYQLTLNAGRETPAALTVAAQAAETSGRQYGPIKRTDTLWGIAGQVGSDQVSIYQTMMAIFLANPHAFLDDNFNHLVEGAMLDIPPLSVSRTISALGAKQRADADNLLWAKLRQAEGKEVKPVTSAKPATKPVTKAVTKPATKSSTKPVTKPVTQAETKPAKSAQTKTQPTTKTDTKPAAGKTATAKPASGPATGTGAGSAATTPSVAAPKATVTAPVSGRSAADQKLIDDLRQQIESNIAQIEALLSENEAMRQRIATLTREMVGLKSQVATLNQEAAQMMPQEHSQSPVADGELPMWLILLLSAVPGAVAVGIIAWWRRQRRRDGLQPVSTVNVQAAGAAGAADAKGRQEPQIAPDLSAAAADAGDSITGFVDVDVDLDNNSIAPPLEASAEDVIQLDDGEPGAAEISSGPDDFDLDDLLSDLNSEQSESVVEFDGDLDELLKGMDNDLSEPTPASDAEVAAEPEVKPQGEGTVMSEPSPAVNSEPELEIEFESLLSPEEKFSDLTELTEAESQQMASAAEKAEGTESTAVTEGTEETQRAESDSDLTDEVKEIEEQGMESGSEDVATLTPADEPVVEARGDALKEEFIELESLLEEAEAADSEEDPYDGVRLDSGLKKSLPITDIGIDDADSLDEADADPDADELATARLDLARAYLEMGDEVSARQALLDVIQRGSELQQSEARKLLDQLG